jgi:hypothetical protein
MNCPITQPQKQNKYKNEKIEIDNIKFDSKKEAKRYLELKQLERAGVIYNLKLQVLQLKLVYKFEMHFSIGGLTMCEFNVIIDGKTQFRDVIYSKVNCENVTVKNRNITVPPIFSIPF